MRRKGRGVLDDRLFVADIATEIVKAPDRDALAGRNLQTAIGHRDEEAEHLQCDRLTAHVWTADHDEARLIVQDERLRDRAVAEKRVAPVLEFDPGCIEDAR